MGYVVHAVVVTVDLRVIDRRTHSALSTICARITTIFDISITLCDKSLSRTHGRTCHPMLQQTKSPHMVVRPEIVAVAPSQIEAMNGALTSKLFLSLYF